MPTSKSTRSPAFQFYPGDFLSSSKVQRMSLTEIGAYTKLLCLNWLDGSLPDDIAILASMVGLKQAAFAKMWTGPLHECFVQRNGRLVNRRLEEEHRKQVEFKRRQSDNGKMGGRPKKVTQNKGSVTYGKSQIEGSVNSGITQIEPKKSSSVFNLQSSSSSTPTSVGVARAHAPIHDNSHRKHAHCGRVCLPASLFGEFVRRRNHADADREIRDWALGVEGEWGPDGPRASEEPGDPFEFWKARYSDKWPSVKVDSRLPAWAR